MKFSLKIFLSVFLIISVVGSLLIWAAHRYVRYQAKKEYVSRYSSLSSIMGQTLEHLDVSTEVLMKNAARVIVQSFAASGIPSNAQLKSIKQSLGVTHIFVIDNGGKFIRSTNEDPSLIPNVFSYCEEYTQLFSGERDFEATPIIHPNPEPKPYKFLYLPTHDRKHLVEVGVRVDFVASALTKALGADPNLISLSLYSPRGQVFGQFDARGVEFGGGMKQIPPDFKPQEAQDSYRFFTKIKASHPKCCQCDKAKSSLNGEYYYVLESEISKKGLREIRASMRQSFLILIAVNLILGLMLAKFIAKRLVANIEMAVNRVREIKSHGGLTKRIRLSGQDELSYLTNEFDRLLDSLQESQSKIIHAEKLQAKVQLAKEVAHNIKSPAVAIGAIMPFLKSLPEGLRNVIKDSSNEIKNLADRLLEQANAESQELEPSNSRIERIHLRSFLENIVSRKTTEHCQNERAFIAFVPDSATKNAFVLADPTELSSILCNIINNAVESYPERKGLVFVFLEMTNNRCIIVVKDLGKGICPAVLSKIGSQEISYGKEGGRGLGLLHAFHRIKQWGGEVEVISEVGKGTSVIVSIPMSLESMGDQTSDHAPSPQQDERLAGS